VTLFVDMPSFYRFGQFRYKTPYTLVIKLLSRLSCCRLVNRIWLIYLKIVSRNSPARSRRSKLEAVVTRGKILDQSD
jgi:hypothetical protein